MPFKITLPPKPLHSLIRNSSFWLGLAYAGLAVLAQFLPLTNDIQYEFAAYIAVFASLLTGITIVLRQSSKEPSQSKATVTQIIPHYAALATIPLAVALIFAAFGEFCGIAEGTEWYMLLVYPSVVISAVLAFLVQMLDLRRWIRVAAFIGIWSGSLFRGAYEAWSGPHIYLYSWQIGFFPGGSWDAELPITGRILLYRAGHLVIAAMLVWLLKTIRHIKNQAPDSFTTQSILVYPVLVALAAIACIIYRPQLGLTATDSWLRAELGDSLHTRYATIYYNRSTTDSVSLWRAANYTDFYIREHASVLRIPEREIKRVNFYAYSSAEEQKRLVGTSSASFTKPWRRTVNMTFSGVGPTLKHELAHVMFSQFGNPLGISMSQGLLEGSAVALASDIDWRTIHKAAKAVYEFNLAPPPAEIMGAGGFTAHRASVSYLIAGSFSRWLIEQFGIEKYKRTFPWGNFEEGYGTSLEKLSNNYRRFIDSLPAPPESYLASARYLYGGGSFFYQRCLRRIGSLTAQAYDALNREKYDQALDLFRSSMEHGITYGARGGILRTLLVAGQFKKMLDSATLYAHDTASYPLLPYLIERGDALWSLGDSVAAGRLYDSVLTLDFGEWPTTRAALRLYFLQTGGLALANIMKVYFTRTLPASQRLLLLEMAEGICNNSQRRVLELMRCQLNSSASPALAVSRLQWASSNTPPATDSSQLYHMVTGLLEESLFDARLYASIIQKDLTLSLSPPQLFSSGSQQFIKARTEERRHFMEFIGFGSILP